MTTIATHISDCSAGRWRSGTGDDGVVREDVPAWLDRVGLLELLAGNGRDPWRRYVEFVEDGAQ
jgi:hypothetical protein